MTLILVKLGFLRLQRTDPVVVNKKFAKKKKKRTRTISCHFDLSSLINEGCMMVNRTKQIFFSPVVGQKREFSSG